MLNRLRQRKAEGFTLIELMIVVAIIGILAAVAIPAFVKYLRKSKTVEATEGLDKLKVGATQYFQADHYDSDGNIAAKAFPNSGATDTKPTQRCCDQATAPKCLPATADWAATPWHELHFGLTDPHYYQWEFNSGAGTSSAASYIAAAIGDLDCDGTASRFELRGGIDTEGGVTVKGPIISNEIE
ncbi:MAG: prepilin-type N-terminal cleavage/methylation domain-containing protein [Proteobacteria bacterium]|nr:prepilin-type N-terminal cleavage/methylation domain-containing protein [Pseudomonadota bacterium]